MSGNPAGAATSLAGLIGNAAKAGGDSLTQALSSAGNYQNPNPDWVQSGWANYRQTLEDQERDRLMKLWGGNNKMGRAF